VRSRIGFAAAIGMSTGVLTPLTSMVILMKALRGWRRFQSLASCRMALLILPWNCLTAYSLARSI
jgi:hypothetical protein